MAKQAFNNIRLGILVLGGLLILVLSLYMIGRNESFFGSDFILKARFSNVNGLMRGNNVRFAGIQCGTVDDIEMLNDTLIEVTLRIQKKTSTYIRTNAFAEIGTEGLMGNKVVNIKPAGGAAPLVTDGYLLRQAPGRDLSDMLTTLATTNDNAALISADLKQLAENLNTSPVLLRLMLDTTIPYNLQRSLVQISRTSADLAAAAAATRSLIHQVQGGRGVAGVLLADETAASELAAAITRVSKASEHAENLTAGLDSLVKRLHSDLSDGRGPFHLLLHDEESARQLSNSIRNIEKGTEAFSEDMEALKHNFLLRPYFRRLEKRNAAGKQ